MRILGAIVIVFLSLPIVLIFLWAVAQIFAMWHDLICAALTWITRGKFRERSDWFLS
jgi:hypothetical protein